MAMAGAVAPASGVTPLIAPSSWSDLPHQKQEILAPLAKEWHTLETWRRQKWLEIAERYPQMSAEEQQRIKGRMNAWVKLTPEERKAAREKYRTVQQATPEQKEALKKMWSEYESLPDEEKARLKQSAGKSAPNTGTTDSPKPAAARLAPTVTGMSSTERPQGASPSVRSSADADVESATVGSKP